MKSIKSAILICSLCLIISFVACTGECETTKIPEVSGSLESELTDISTQVFCDPPILTTFVFYSHEDFETYLSTGSKNPIDYLSTPESIDELPSPDVFKNKYISIEDLFNLNSETLLDIQKVQFYDNIRSDNILIQYKFGYCTVDFIYEKNHNQNIVELFSATDKLSHNFDNLKGKGDEFVLRVVDNTEILYWFYNGDLVGLYFIYKGYSIYLTPQRNYVPDQVKHATFYGLLSTDDEVFAQAVTRIFEVIDEKTTGTETTE